jgi:hypothetical protein
MIQFVKVGQQVRRSKTKILAVSPKTFADISVEFEGAQDWECHFDLPESVNPMTHYILPTDVFMTALKADDLISRNSRCCILLELTCPLEENILQWHKTKTAKYAELCRDAEQLGWKVHFFAVEVGARGWIPSATPAQWRAFGQPPDKVKTLCKRLSMIALKSSYVIWINRFKQEFATWRIRE